MSARPRGCRGTHPLDEHCGEPAPRSISVARYARRVGELYRVDRRERVELLGTHGVQERRVDLAARHARRHSDGKRRAGRHEHRAPGRRRPPRTRDHRVVHSHAALAQRGHLLVQRQRHHVNHVDDSVSTKWVTTRDPERTKAALLDAALIEFSAHGRAGARTSAIARRAGVNKQLISHHFGGKDGLYRALVERWEAEEERYGGPDVPLADLDGALRRGRRAPPRPAPAAAPRLAGRPGSRRRRRSG